MNNITTLIIILSVIFLNKSCLPNEKIEITDYSWLIKTEIITDNITELTQEDVDNMIGSVIILELKDQNTSFLNEEYSNIIIEDITIDCNEYLDGHFGINGTDICKTSKTFIEHNIYFKDEGEKFEYILYTILEFDSSWILSYKGLFFELEEVAIKGK